MTPKLNQPEIIMPFHSQQQENKNPCNRPRAQNQISMLVIITYKQACNISSMYTVTCILNALNIWSHNYNRDQTLAK